MKQSIDTFIGFEPKECILCFNEMELEKTELIISGDENYTKKSFRCQCGHRIDALYERGNDPKGSC